MFKFRCAYVLVLGLILSALAPACKTKQATHSSHTKTDSTYTTEREVLRVDTVTIPADSAAIMALVQCPNGGNPILIYKHDTITLIKEVGRRNAGINLSLVGGVLKAQGNCKQLEALVIAKDKYINFYRKLYEANKESIFKTTAVPYIPRWVYWLVALNILGALYSIGKLLIKWGVITLKKPLPF